MADTLVRPVVHIDEQRFPVCTQRVVIHCIAMVLRGDETTLRAHHTYRLVMAAVTILQFIDSKHRRLWQATGCPCKYRRSAFVLHRLADIPDSGIASIRIAGPLEMNKPIVLQLD